MHRSTHTLLIGRANAWMHICEKYGNHDSKKTMSLSNSVTMWGISRDSTFLPDRTFKMLLQTDFSVWDVIGKMVSERMAHLTEDSVGNFGQILLQSRLPWCSCQAWREPSLWNQRPFKMLNHSLTLYIVCVITTIVFLIVYFDSSLDRKSQWLYKK